MKTYVCVLTKLFQLGLEQKNNILFTLENIIFLLTTFARFARTYVCEKAIIVKVLAYVEIH